MNLIDWQVEFGRCAYDSTVGIKIAKLAGDSQFATFLTAIDPGKSVNPHYHKNGDEHYHIISGHGEMTLIDVASKKETVTSVNEGQSFVVPANTLHQLKNTGQQALTLMFSCPESHLKEDRFILSVQEKRISNFEPYPSSSLPISVSMVSLVQVTKRRQ